MRSAKCALCGETVKLSGTWYIVLTHVQVGKCGFVQHVGIKSLTASEESAK